MHEHILDWYLWNDRPQNVARPDWFSAWPNRARIAVTIKVMIEWESVPHPTGRRRQSGGSHQEDYRALGTREYGFKAGAERVMDMLDRQGIKVTAMVSGLSAGLWTDTVRALKEKGHEIASHQWDQCIPPLSFKTKEEERASLRRSMDAITRVTGERPCGYMSPGPWPSVNTPEAVAEEGFVWNGDYHDTDIPYIMNIKGKKVVSLGYVRPAFTDNDLAEYGLAAGLQQLKDEFAATYEEARQHPMKFSYGMHIHNSGPGQVRMVEKFIEHVKGHEGVWFCRCMDMANYWLVSSGR